MLSKEFYGLVCTVLVLVAVSAADAEQPLPMSPAVHQALAAELAGDSDKRAELLREAITADPNDAAARWHAGQVQHEGKWLSPLEVIDRALTDDDLAEYARQRARRSNSVVGQAALARWCAKHDLEPQARAHWIQVLRLDPDHRVAQKELGVVRFEGELVTLAERDRLQAERKEFDSKQKQLDKRFERIATNLLSDNLDRIGQAREAIGRLTQPEEVQALVAALGPAAAETDQAEEMYNLLIDMVALIHEPWANDLLVQEATNSEFESVRTRATAALEYRPAVEVVPLLLSRMKMPLELTTSINQGDGDIGYRSDYYREGPTGPEYDYSYTDRARPCVPRYAYLPVTTQTQVSEGYTLPEVNLPRRIVTSRCGGNRYWAPAYYRPETYVPPAYRTDVVGYMYAGERADYLNAQREIYRNAVYKKQQTNQMVERANESTALSNQQVERVLKATTGEDLGQSPRDWWNWWQQKLAGNAKLRDADRLSVTLGLVQPEPHGFAMGTPVWTRLGLRPIEQVLVGDEVLAQNPATGELAFKPVLATEEADLERLNRNRASNRQVDRIMVRKLEIERRTLGLAPGQRTWSIGQGWQAAEDLTANAKLHGHDGAEVVSSVNETETPALRYLIVDEFHTVLVGKESILAHDAMPPERSTLDLPGWRADGERLAGR